jgi:CheY-like chemotaxis protein
MSIVPVAKRLALSLISIERPVNGIFAFVRGNGVPRLAPERYHAMRDRNTIAVTILVCDDDADDRKLTEQALRDARVSNRVLFVADGEELLDYLYQRDAFSGETGNAPRPGLILLDLNMPKVDGREALQVIKSDPALRDIPIVVLTTSRLDEDVIRSYQLGVNSFMTKPVTFSGLVEAMRVLGRYWLQIVELPPIHA